MSRFQTLWRIAPQPIVLGLLLFFCAGFADGVLIPFFPLWARFEAGVPSSWVGVLFGCYAGGELLATPLIGGISDRVGRRSVLIASSLGVGGGFAALYFVHGVPMTAAVLLYTGICESVLHPTIMAIISDRTEPNDHHRWFSLAQLSSGAGQVVGPAIGGCLALISLRATFLASSAALLFGGLAILISSARRIDYGPHERAPHSGCDEDDEGLSALIPAIRDGRLARLLVWLVLFEIASNWLESVIPLYAHDAGTLPSSGVGMLFAYAAVLVVALQMPVARLAKDWPAPKVLTGAGVATAVAFLLLAASPSLLCLILSVTLCALAQMFMGPLIPLTLSALAPLSRRASYMAASSVAVDLKDTLGPSLGTLLYAVAPRLPWIAGIPVVALASLGLGVEMRRNRTAVQPNRAARPVS